MHFGTPYYKSEDIHLNMGIGIFGNNVYSLILFEA